MDHKKLSGASYLKKSRETAQKFADVLSKTKKIDKFFLFQMPVRKLFIVSSIKVRNCFNFKLNKKCLLRFF